MSEDIVQTEVALEQAEEWIKSQETRIEALEALVKKLTVFTTHPKVCAQPKKPCSCGLAGILDSAREILKEKPKP